MKYVGESQWKVALSSSTCTQPGTRWIRIPARVFELAPLQMVSNLNLEVLSLEEEVPVMEETTTTMDRIVQGVGTVALEVAEGVMDKKGGLVATVLVVMEIGMEGVEVAAGDN